MAMDMLAQGVRRSHFIPMKQGKALKWIFTLLFAWTLTYQNAYGQTETDDDQSALGSLYLKGFEQVCSNPIQEYEDCYSTRDDTGSDCHDEFLAVLSCSNNCPAVYDSIIWCAVFVEDCTDDAIIEWIQCSHSYCTNTYLVPYGLCVEEQRAQDQCSSCPFFTTTSGDLLSTLTPGCGVFEEDYCTWQSCCEPCQYYLNFYGECMQVNFNTCGSYFQDNPDLPTCPLLILDAQPPTFEEAEEDSPSGNDESTTTNTNDNPATDSAFGYSRMTWLSCVVWFFLVLV